MRLTTLGNRLACLAVLAAVCAPGAGCRRGPYLDSSRAVPHDPAAFAAEEDNEVKQAAFLHQNLSLPLPKMSDPRTTSNPEAEEIWEITLPEAIRIGLDNSEVVRVISLGAQGIPVGGFEPTPLNTGAGAGVASSLGSGTLATVYDPAIQETQIAQALSVFDANLSTTLFWNKNVAPFNNAISAGSFVAGAKFPVIFDQETANFTTQIQKRAANGSTFTVAHNVVYNFQNSPINVFPSAYTTNTQLRFSQPLLGGSQQFGPSGLEANRAPIIIARLNADSSVWRFKAEIMAEVRSIEQQYWALTQAQMQYWASETAVDLGEQILRREKAKFEVGQGSLPNVAEAQEQLERFKLDYIDKTANLITTERQLRNILGMPPTDNRRILPVTAPTEARLEPDWQSSLAQMIAFQPDIVQNQLLVRVAELQLLVARNLLLPVLNFDALYQFNGLGHHLDQAEAVMTGSGLKAINPILQNMQRAAGLNPQPGTYNYFQTWQLGFTFQMPLGFRNALANTRQAQYALLRQRAFLQQIVHQTTHSLARFFLEVDSNYKLFKTAGRLKAAALQRLEAQRAFYENGTITIDRYLDAVNRWATAVAQEAQFRTQYNISIAALEEAKGTLLAYDNIAVAEGPWPAKAYVQARDQQGSHHQFHVPPDGNYQGQPVNGPAMVDPMVPMAPPNVEERGTVPPMPAPIGPLRPAPRPAPPQVPAGEPNVHANRNAPPSAEPGVIPASISAPVEPLPPLPSGDGNGNGNGNEAGAGDEIPPLPG